jgi:phage-related minor tail protein
LVDGKGNPSLAKLSVQITQDSTSTVAGDAVEQAQMFAQKLSQPLVSNVSDAFTNISDTLSNQQKLVTSFNALMKRVEPLVKMADEVAQVRSSPLLHKVN